MNQQIEKAKTEMLIKCEPFNLARAFEMGVAVGRENPLHELDRLPDKMSDESKRERMITEADKFLDPNR